jgi:ubiquinone/menaquinone biosynthesis C-methylase UbiE
MTLAPLTAQLGAIAAFAAPPASPRGHRGAAQPRSRAKDWDAHVDHMERLAATPSFQDLRDRILEAAQLRAGDVVLDLGAGTGLLALAAAPRVSQVYALDISAGMCERLASKAERAGIGNVEVLAGSATELPLGDGAADAVVSNYCFHHLRDAEKELALAEIRRVLRPGGRLAFGDMMFSVSLVNRRDRHVILRVVRRMLAHGPAGVARVLRNTVRVAGGRGEHPAPVAWWRKALPAAGFTEVSVHALDHEGGIARARRP